MEINSYSDEIKRNKGLAKILSCSHFKGEENKNDMIFKSTDLKDIIEIIHNRKPKNNKENEIKVQIDKSKGSTCCGLEECRIF